MSRIRFDENWQGEFVAVVPVKARCIEHIAKSFQVHIGRFERDSKNL
jgi:hypothetical protein